MLHEWQNNMDIEVVYVCYGRVLLVYCYSLLSWSFMGKYVVPNEM